MLGLILATVGFVMAASHSGWEFDAVLSGSMEPELGVGGLVVVKPVDGNDVKVGDIISFKIPSVDTPICHRVVDRIETDDGFLLQTKGDANEEADATLLGLENVNGRALVYLPYVGYLGRLAEFGRNKVNVMGWGVPMAALVIAGMGLVFIGLTMKDFLEDIYRPYKRMRRERDKKRKERLLKRRRTLGMSA